MLDYAATPAGPDSRIEWREADELDLPFEDASFEPGAMVLSMDQNLCEPRMSSHQRAGDVSAFCGRLEL